MSEAKYGMIRSNQLYKLCLLQQISHICLVTVITNLPALGGVFRNSSS